MSLRPEALLDRRAGQRGGQRGATGELISSSSDSLCSNNKTHQPAPSCSPAGSVYLVSPCRVLRRSARPDRETCSCEESCHEFSRRPGAGPECLSRRRATGGSLTLAPPLPGPPSLAL
eukprot:751472-Hanusia_phi.AAC.9